MQGGLQGSDHTTELTEVLANDASTEIFNPMTRPFNTTHLDDVRIGHWLDSSDLTVKTGVQFSNDGVEFDSAIAIGASFSSTTGWSIPTTFTSLFGLTGTKRTYCRFGLFAKNQSGSDTGGAQARLSIEARPMAGRTVVAGPVKVNTDGTTTAIFHPMTGALRAADVSEIRSTILLDAASGLSGSTSLIYLQAGYQQTDTPDDETSWTTATAFGGQKQAEGTGFPTSFTSVSLTKRYIRFGLMAENDSSSSDIESCIGTLRIDMRKT